MIQKAGAKGKPGLVEIDDKQDTYHTQSWIQCHLWFLSSYQNASEILKQKLDASIPIGRLLICKENDIVDEEDLINTDFHLFSGNC